MRLTSLVGLLLTLTPSILAKSKKNDAVLLSNVRSLTLRDGQDTSHRRVSALPQLNCVGGNGKGLYDVDVMRCTNSGSEYDAEDIQWTCKADLPPDFKLGSTEVICEGYDSPDDPYVLKGSCGVEYRLMLTDLGEEKYRDRINQRPWKSRNKNRDGTGSDKPAAIIFWIIFALIVIAILYSVFFPSGRQPRHGFGDGFRTGYNGFGGGGDDNDDPPPPYTPRAPKPKSYGSTRSSSSRASSSRQQNQPWRPGFWTGTATGAAAGYAAGSYANRQDRNHARPGTSNWFGGTNTSPTYDRPPPRSNYGGGWGGGSSSAGPSSSRHESTGFGGTSRR